METIRSSTEISRVFKEGRRIGTSNLTLIVLRNEKQHGHNGRAAFVAGKKLGNAVWRNKAKRRLRAACRDLKCEFPNCDVVFLAKKSTTEVPYRELLESVNKALIRGSLR